MRQTDNKMLRINRSLKHVCKQLRHRETLKEVDLQLCQGAKSKYFTERKFSDKTAPRVLGRVSTLAETW